MPIWCNWSEGYKNNLHHYWKSINKIQRPLKSASSGFGVWRLKRLRARNLSKRLMRCRACSRKMQTTWILPNDKTPMTWSWMKASFSRNAHLQEISFETSTNWKQTCETSNKKISPKSNSFQFFPKEPTSTHCSTSQQSKANYSITFKTLKSKLLKGPSTPLHPTSSIFSLYSAMEMKWLKWTFWKNTILKLSRKWSSSEFQCWHLSSIRSTFCPGKISSRSKWNLLLRMIQVFLTLPSAFSTTETLLKSNATKALTASSLILTLNFSEALRANQLQRKAWSTASLALTTAFLWCFIWWNKFPITSVKTINSMKDLPLKKRENNKL